MPLNAAGAFVEAIRKNNLLEAARLAELTQHLVPHFPDPVGLAAELVRRAWLTEYQARQLIAGQDLVYEHYVVLELISEGGMGRVYKARQNRLKRLAALKVIRPECLRSGYAVERFQREAEIVARLDHPNVVRVYDAGEVRGTPYLAMEYLEGTDLARLVRERGSLPVSLACDYIRQAALGLHHAHQLGLVHRDVKPHNLMLTKQGIVKVLDLGLAHQGRRPDAATAAGLTATGAILGTPDYLAPEQVLDASRVDARADVYGLGCTLFYLLTGRSPFAGESLNEKLLKHVMHDPTPIETLRGDLPPGLADLIRRMMAKMPNDRHPSAADAAAALGPFLRVEPPPVVAGLPPSRRIEPTLEVPVARRSHDTSMLATLPPETAVPLAIPFPEPTPSLINVPSPRQPRPGRTRWVIGSVVALGLAVLAIGVAVALWPSRKDRRDEVGNQMAPQKTTPAPVATRPSPPNVPTLEQIHEADLLNRQGLALHQKRDYSRALEVINQSLRLNPRASAAWNNRGLVYLAMGDFDRCIEDCTRAIELQSDNATAYFNRGHGYFGKQNYEKAIEEFTRTLDLDPKFESALNNRGAAYFSLGKNDKAIEDFNRALRLNSEFADAYCNRGAVYTNLREYEKALADFQDALRINPKYPGALLNRGQLYFSREQYDKAIDDFTEAITLDPTFAQGYMWRGKTYAQKGNKKLSEKDLEEALRLDPRLGKLPR